MTVAELIAKLHAFAPNERVCIDTDMGATDIDQATLHEGEPGAEENPTFPPIRTRHVLLW